MSIVSSCNVLSTGMRDRIGGHDRPHLGQLRVFPLSRDPEGDVPVGENAAQLAQLFYHEASDIAFL
jgi:hypothetical protein